MQSKLVKVRLTHLQSQRWAPLSHDLTQNHFCPCAQHVVLGASMEQVSSASTISLPHHHLGVFFPAAAPDPEVLT